MKKALLVLFASVALIGFAENIKMKDGKEYKDVEVLNHDPAGIDICFKQGDETIVKHILLKDCPEKIQKKYKYHPKKAESYQKHCRKFLKAASEKRLREARKKHLAYIREQKEENEISAAVSAGRVHVILKVTQRIGSGVIAWADSPHYTDTTIHYGKIFVTGLHIQQNAEWAGTIYPTGTTANGYECYAPTFDLAVGVKMAALKNSK